MDLRRLQRRFGELIQLKFEIENFRRSLDSIPIIVEGRNDKISLENLGFVNIHVIAGKPLYKIVEEIPATEEVLILTDFDSEGRRKEKELTNLFTKIGAKPLHRLRAKFRTLFEVDKVEDVKIPLL